MSSGVTARSLLLRSSLWVHALVVGSLPAFAQSVQVSGTIKDPDQSVVSGAVVTLSNAQSATPLQTTTNGSGQYTFSSVAPGSYRLAAHKPGFVPVGADKAYDTKDFIAATRALNVTAHVTKNEKGRRSNLDRRTTRHPGYAISLSRRWLIEKGFGWLKQTGPIRQVKLRGLHKVDWLFVFSCAAHNLMRLPKLIALGRQARPVEQRA
jgi:hypothetical protein